MEISVRQQKTEDWPVVWRILKPVFRAGLSYPVPLDINERDAREYWIKKDGFNAVAFGPGGEIVGVYYLRPDQGGPGSHICNAGYVVAETARGRGIAVEMCRESQIRARDIGYLGMKFNLVVAANKPAVSAWSRAGMETIGVTPQSFRLPDGSYSDALIMFKSLQTS